MKSFKKVLACGMIMVMILSNLTFADVNATNADVNVTDADVNPTEAQMSTPDSENISLNDFYDELNYRDDIEAFDADLEKGAKKFFESNDLSSELKVFFAKDKKTPTFITGFTSKNKVNSKSKSEDFMNQSKELFGVKNGSFITKEVLVDELNTTHYKLQQTIDDVDVYGGEIILHTDSDGTVYAVNGNTIKGIKSNNWSNKFKLSSIEAVDAAIKTLDFKVKDDTFLTEPSAIQYIYKYKNNYHPVYLVTLEFINPYPSNLKLFVSATNGKIVNMYNALADADGATTGTGVGVFGDTRTINTYLSQGNYYLYDTSKSAMTGQIRTYDANNGSNYSIPGSYMTDADNNFNAARQKAGVDAHYFAGVAYDYYHDVHGRNSYDNQGTSLISSVHFGNKMNNAFWSGSQMFYGDGDGNVFAPLSAALDVVAHELTHAVTDTSAKLEYQTESGALNESFSDVFGAIIDHQEFNTSDWWRLGEVVYTPNTAGDSLRDMKNPTLCGQPAHMNDFVVSANTEAGDWGGVHTNSGIPNKAFYEIATQIGLEKSGKIYYRALTTYLTSTSQFDDARNGLLESAKDLYGLNSAEYVAVGNGYASVGIGNPISTELVLKNATVTVDQATNNGNYKITIAVPANNGATSVELFENNTTSISTHTFVAGQSSVLSFDENFAAKTPGTYSYKAVVSDGTDTLTSNIINVTVTDVVVGTWTTVAITYNTPHNYANNYNNTVYYYKEGASKVGVYFEYFRLEQDYDYVYVMDKNNTVIQTLTGNHDNTWVEVNGDTIRLKIVTDGYVTDWGYRLSQAKYFK